LSKKREGFTLIEMLVAIVLVSLLVSLAMFSFKYQFTIIKRAKSNGIKTLLRYNQLRSSLQSMDYYVVDDYNTFQNPMKRLHFYFNANKTEVDYITKNPIFSDNISVVKLFCKDKNLMYQEEPLYKRINFLEPEVKKDSQKAILFKNLDKCEFSYSIQNKQLDVLKEILPESIIINIKNKNIEPIYVNIKSDYNISLGVMQDAIYPAGQ